MPSAAEAEVARRGGAVRYRWIRQGDERILVAVVRKAGPDGGHTVVLKREKVSRETRR